MAFSLRSSQWLSNVKRASFAAEIRNDAAFFSVGFFDKQAFDKISAYIPDADESQ